MKNFTLAYNPKTASNKNKIYLHQVKETQIDKELDDEFDGEDEYESETEENLEEEETSLLSHDFDSLYTLSSLYNRNNYILFLIVKLLMHIFYFTPLFFFNRELCSLNYQRYNLCCDISLYEKRYLDFENYIGDMNNTIISRNIIKEQTELKIRHLYLLYQSYVDECLKKYGPSNNRTLIFIDWIDKSERMYLTQFKIFLSDLAELQHDTTLYSKQAITLYEAVCSFKRTVRQIDKSKKELELLHDMRYLSNGNLKQIQRIFEKVEQRTENVISKIMDSKNEANKILLEKTNNNDNNGGNGHLFSPPNVSIEEMVNSIIKSDYKTTLTAIKIDDTNEDRQITEILL